MPQFGATADKNTGNHARPDYGIGGGVCVGLTTVGDGGGVEVGMTEGGVTVGRGGSGVPVGPSAGGVAVCVARAGSNGVAVGITGWLVGKLPGGSSGSSVGNEVLAVAVTGMTPVAVGCGVLVEAGLTIRRVEVGATAVGEMPMTTASGGKSKT